MLAVLIAGHQVHQGVAALFDAGVVVGDRAVDVAVEAALPAQPTAHGHLVECARQAVGVEQPHYVLRLGGCQREAENPLVVGVAGTGVGVAGGDVPAGCQFAGQLQFDALGGGTVDGLVDAFVGHRVGADVGGDVVLLDAEERQGAVQPAVEPGSLQPGFIAVTFDGGEGGAVDVLVNLWLIDRGVAGIHRVGVVQVIDHARIRGDHTVFLVACVGVAQRRRWVIVLIIVVLEGADPGAEDERKLVGRPQAGGHVGAVLALGGGVVAVFREFLYRDLAVPVEDRTRDLGEGTAVVGVTGLARVRGHEACNQVVLTAKEGERPGDVQVCGVLHTVPFPAPPVEEHAFAGRGVGVATAG
ncbi:hypothetical protein D3C81_561920 [compost metagenome]